MLMEEFTHVFRNTQQTEVVAHKPRSVFEPVPLGTVIEQNVRARTIIG